jgi:HSP20 family molecular chaperone IbpA
VVAPDLRSEGPPTAEILVAAHAITVTVAVPQAERADVDILLTRHSIRLRHRREPGRLNLVIPLPVAVEPERYVLRESHGVYDFVVERASR